MKQGVLPLPFLLPFISKGNKFRQMLQEGEVDSTNRPVPVLRNHELHLLPAFFGLFVVAFFKFTIPVEEHDHVRVLLN